MWIITEREREREAEHCYRRHLLFEVNFSTVLELKNFKWNIKAAPAPPQLLCTMRAHPFSAKIKPELFRTTITTEIVTVDVA
jgi:hypothetical protein